MELTEETYQGKRQIGSDYRILKKIGYGGDGTVYLVRHCPTEQLRAAKRLKADASRQRRHELDMMKHLRHPALPQVFDILEECGELWLIMEFINGRPLSALKKDEPEPAAFFSIACQLADVLLYLHTRRQPILHLDIKPSNILLRSDGSLVLIDFGAAIRAAPEGKKVVCFGTPGFAAPEQSDPALSPDCRADQYGFGAVLYYCLYREIPESTVSCHARMKSDRAYWRRITKPLILRCLEKDRGKRFPDTRSLCDHVRKAEKRYSVWKGRYRRGAAIIFLFSVLTFTAANLRGEVLNNMSPAEIKDRYDALLEEADSLGFEQAVVCYRQALSFCPEDSAWCERLLDRIESDYSFSCAEEEVLRELIFSAPQGKTDTEDDLLARSSPEYGTLAYRIGLVYWYFYEGAGGRSAASRWFKRAIESQDANTRHWYASARIHARIGSYYETLGKTDIDGKLQADAGIYWKDLSELWSLESLGDESFGVRYEIAKEMLSVLIMQTHELHRKGVKKEQLRAMLLSIRAFVEENCDVGEIGPACGVQCEAAQEAIGREFSDERGLRNEAAEKEK